MAFICFFLYLLLSFSAELSVCFMHSALNILLSWAVFLFLYHAGVHSFFLPWVFSGDFFYCMKLYKDYFCGTCHFRLACLVCLISCLLGWYLICESLIVFRRYF